MAGGKFVLNKATVRWAANNDRGIVGGVDAIGEKLHAEAGPKSYLDFYNTDRHVAGVTARSIDQAKHGILTKAAGILGRRVRQRG